MSGNAMTATSASVSARCSIVAGVQVLSVAMSKSPLMATQKSPPLE